jgi:sulfatase maturation enzyme AslB (radical SAM superfamily)
VLAGHTAPHITEIYDSFRERVRRLRFLPLFNGPDSRSLDLVDASPELLTEALCRLFVHWFDHGCQPEMLPLNGYFRSVILKMLDLEQMPYDRRNTGDHVFVVDLDGKLYAPNAAYTGAFGSLMESPIEEILDSAPYLATLDADDTARASICGSCDYRGGCDTYPLLSNPDGGIAQGRCLVAKPVCEFIESFLRREGFDEGALRAMFDDIGAGFSDTAPDPLPL